MSNKFATMSKLHLRPKGRTVNTTVALDELLICICKIRRIHMFRSYETQEAAVLYATRTGSIEQIHKFHHMFNKLMQETIQTKSHEGSKNMQEIMAELIWLLTTHI